MRRAPLPILFMACLSSACGADPATEPVDASTTGEVVFRTTGGERSLDVRIADSDAERQRGLMGVRELADDEGMAFVFDEPSETEFWMKETLIPLAIAFVGEDGHVLAISEMTPCREDPCPTTGPPAPSTMAVEANAGWFSSNGVGVGDESVLLEEE